MNILIVEDEEAMADIMADMLRPLGAEVHVVNTMQGMKTRVQPVCPYDVILLDLNLPDSPAEQTLLMVRYMKLNCLTAVIIVVTGQPQIHENEVRDAGADAFLYKPDMADPQALLQSISTALSSRSSSIKKIENQLALNQMIIRSVSKQIA